MIISNVTHSNPAAEHKPLVASGSPTVYQTPFGDVLASQITGIDLNAWANASNSSAATTAGTAAKVQAVVNDAAKKQAALRTTAAIDPTAVSPSGTTATRSTQGNTTSATPTTTTTATTTATTTTTTTPSTPSPNSVPTIQSVFGADPWVTNAGGSGAGGAWNYNPIYFATPQAAQIVAQMLGGTVVAVNAITTAGGPLMQNQPNQMVQLPNGAQINAGLVADLFNHGYPQSYINQELAALKQQGVSAT
jgi:hypothetical protein